MMRKALKPCVAETIGTFALCFIGAGSICVNAGLVGVALAHGCVLAVMISALGHISGGHFNPAVTLGAWVGGKISVPMAGWYVASQLGGAVVAGGVLRLGLSVGDRGGGDAGDPRVGPGL